MFHWLCFFWCLGRYWQQLYRSPSQCCSNSASDLNWSYVLFCSLFPSDWSLFFTLFLSIWSFFSLIEFISGGLSETRATLQFSFWCYSGASMINFGSDLGWLSWVTFEGNGDVYWCIWVVFIVELYCARCNVNAVRIGRRYEVH